MKVRRVTLEIEVSWKWAATTIVVLVSGALNHAGIRNQVRLVEQNLSTNEKLPERRK